MQRKLILSISLSFILLVSLVSATLNPGTCVVLDDFESNTLNSNLWEVKQDLYGYYSLTDSYGITNENSNNVFHIEQSDGQNRITYLYLKRTLYSGETLEYDVNITGTNNFAHMLLTTKDAHKIAMIGTNVYWGSVAVVEEGLTHVTLTMNDTDMIMKRELPSGNVFESFVPITNGETELYIGASSKDGNVHADFDNFKVCNTDLPVVPEFGLIAGLTTIALAIASFFYIRRN